MWRFRSVLSAVVLNVDRQPKQLLVILLKPLEVRLDRSCDLPRVLDRKEMADDLTVMLGLARRTKPQDLFSAISASDIT
jgi:hypothetical protein